MDGLIEKIKTLKQNSDYRVSDILIEAGHRWKHSTEQVLTNPIYQDTILYQYLTTYKQTKPPNLNKFMECVHAYRQKYQLPIPDKNELVMHLRMGDVVAIPDFDAKRTPIKSVREMKSKYPSINKVTIVTCFAYQAWSEDSLHLKPEKTPLWSYTDESQQKNIAKMKDVLQKISTNFPKLTIDIVSNENVDHDIVYCAYAPHFISDYGGFSKLLHKLQQIKKNPSYQ